MADAELRLLLVDGCQLNAWLVRHLAPAGVHVELTQSFDRARVMLRSEPPDAAIFNVTPSELPWQELAALCRESTPPIPFMWCSTVYDDVEEMGAQQGPDEQLCFKPVAVSEMRLHIEKLVHRARRAAERRRADSGAARSPEAQR